MKYQAQLSPWVIFQIAAGDARHPVSRFRRRNDADAYMRVLNNTKPDSKFIVAFDTESFIAPKVDATLAAV